MIYLDYQATTPLAAESRAAMLPWLSEEGSANPHSAHAAGRKARAAIELARDQVAELLPFGGKVYFTSGATEALNWALIGSGARRIAVGATEHAAVLDTVSWLRDQGREVHILPADREGRIDCALAEVELVAVMQVNNEIGTIAPLIRQRGALLLCDAVQGFGRLAPPEGADLIAISAHKIHGPKGVGALWVRDGVSLAPFMHGGGQEGGLRSGTLSPALCAGFGAAAALAATRMEADAAHVGRLWHLAIKRLGPGWIVNGSTRDRWFGNLNVRRDDLDSARLISELRDIAFSSGSACASGSGRPSHVLRAIGLSDAQARASIRLGFGRYTTEAELMNAIDRIVTAADAQTRIAA